MIMNLL